MGEGRKTDVEICYADALEGRSLQVTAVLELPTGHNASGGLHLRLPFFCVT